MEWILRESVLIPVYVMVTALEIIFGFQQYLDTNAATQTTIKWLSFFLAFEVQLLALDMYAVGPPQDQRNP